MQINTSALQLNIKEQFLDTYNTIKQLELPFLHIFSYSQRTGTPTYSVKQVLKEEIKKRTNLLQSLSNNIKHNYLRNKLNTATEVLVKANNTEYSNDYCSITINSTIILPNHSVVSVKIIALENNNLIAETIQNV